MTTADELLHELAALASTLGPALRPASGDALLRALTETARQLFDASACSLALLSADETELIYTTAAGAGAETVTGLRIAADTGLAGWVVQSGQPIAVSDVTRDSRFSRASAEQTGYVPRAVLAVPVASKRRMLGVLTLLDRNENRPGAERDMTLLALFADQAAISLESAAVFDDVGRMLLAALADAAGGTGDLAASIDRVARDLPAPDDDLARLAATFATLSRQGAAERALAAAVLTQVADYAQRRAARPR